MIRFFQIKSLIFYKLLQESQIVANFFKGIRTLIVVRGTTTLPLSYKENFYLPDTFQNLLGFPLDKRIFQRLPFNQTKRSNSFSRVRTCDITVNSRTLYQLSYKGILFLTIHEVTTTFITGPILFLYRTKV
jgi:hypothetical protein